MQPTVPDLVAQIGEQAVEIRYLRRQLEAAKAAVRRAEEAAEAAKVQTPAPEAAPVG